MNSPAGVILHPQPLTASLKVSAARPTPPLAPVTMNWVAWKMLVGNRTKYLVMLFGMTFASLLIAQQLSIFCGVLRMSAGQIRDVRDAILWVIDPNVRYI